MITLLLVSYCFILMAFNTFNADFINYNAMYVAMGEGTYTGKIREVGYAFFVVVANELGWSYQEFLIFFAGICSLLLLKIVLDYCEYPNPVLSMTLVYPLLINIIQLRFFLAFLIVLYSIRFLFQPSACNSLKYFCGIAVAATFHLSSLLYLILCLLLIKSKRRLVLFGLIIIILSIALSPWLYGIFDSLSADKLSEYSENNYFTVNKLVRVMVLLLSSVAVAYLCMLIQKKKGFCKDVIFLQSASLLFFIGYIMVLISNEFERILRPAYFVLYVASFNLLFSRYHPIMNKIIYGILFSLLMTMFFVYFFYFRYSNDVMFEEAVFETLINNNSLIY